MSRAGAAILLLLPDTPHTGRCRGGADRGSSASPEDPIEATAVLLRGPDGKTVSGALVASQDAARYVPPVLVLEDGTVLPPDHATRRGYRLVTATEVERIRLQAAGYRLK